MTTHYSHDSDSYKLTKHGSMAVFKVSVLRDVFIDHLVRILNRFRGKINESKSIGSYQTIII